MRKIFLLALLFISVNLFAQDKKDTVDKKDIPASDKSNIAKFLGRPGVLLRTDYIDLDEIGDIKFELMKVTDLDNGTTIIGLRLSGLSNSYFNCSCFLDQDELSMFDRAVTLMADTAKKNDPKVGLVEYDFVSRSDFKFSTFSHPGAYSLKRRWEVYCDLNDTNIYTHFTYNPADLPKIKAELDMAIAKIGDMWFSK